MSSISVIVPCYNAEKFVSGFLRKMRAQTFTDWELIFVDDRSTDTTKELIYSEISGDRRIKLISTDYNSGGPFVPRCFGLKEAHAELVCFLDIDDNVSDNYLESMSERLITTGADIVFPDMRIDGESLTTEDMDKIYDGRSLVCKTLYAWKIGCGGGLYRKELLKKVYLSELPELCETELRSFADRVPAIEPYAVNKSGSFLPRYVDEVGTRMILTHAARVAFAHDAVYTYVIGEQSISSYERIDSVAFLLNDYLMSRWIPKEYNDDLTLGNLYRQQFCNVILKMKLLRRRKGRIPPEEYLRSREFVKAMFGSIDRKRIRPFVHGPLYLMTSSGYRVAEVLLPLHPY